MATGTINPFDTRDKYTRVHNYVIDEMMPSLKPNAFKVLVYIIRKTKGWGKDADCISYSQLREGTGIKSDATLAAALTELQELQYILCEKSSGFTNNYVLNTTLEIKVVDTSTVFEGGTSTEIEEVPLQKLKTQKKDLNKDKERDCADAREASPSAHRSPSPSKPKAAMDLEETTGNCVPPNPPQTCAPPASPKRSKTTPEQTALMDKYKELIAEDEGERALSTMRYPVEWVGIKRMATAGYTPDELAHVYGELRRDRWWKGKHIPAQTMASQAGAILAKLGGDVVVAGDAVALAFEW